MPPDLASSASEVGDGLPVLETRAGAVMSEEAVAAAFCPMTLMAALLEAPNDVHGLSQVA